MTPIPSRGFPEAETRGFRGDIVKGKEGSLGEYREKMAG